MSNTLGNKLRVTVFGQSHAPAIGAVVEGLPAGMRPDLEAVSAFMARRAPGRDATATARREADAVEIIAGLNERGEICGAPVAGIIRNTDTRSRDYSNLYRLPRPGHADFSAWEKFGDARDVRGGGQFSGRLTAPLCFAGALALQFLREKGVTVAAHIASIAGIDDDTPDFVYPAFPLYAADAFPVLNAEAGERMRAAILEAKRAGDSVGGVVRVIATGMPAGLGEPMFDGLENRLAAALFGIPAVRGVEFGLGFAAAGLRGSQHNDAFAVRDGKIVTETNRHAGALGGITTGMPVVCQVAFKPTASIAIQQKTVDLQTKEEAPLIVHGRHDPCIVPRAVPVVEAVAALVLADMILEGAN